MWDKVKQYWSKTNRWHRVLLIFLLVELRLIPGGQVGFWCHDPALSHPFTGDTVTWKWLFSLTILFPLPVMLSIERKYHSNEKTKESARSRGLTWYKEYLFGLLINVIVVQTIKLIVGSPRPHFFDTCQPEEASNCQSSEYVARYTCTKAAWQHQSDKSFPSGHTSLALHAAFFVVYYIHRRTKPTATMRCAQALCALCAAACALSRVVVDRRHHWHDVAGGAALALPVLLYTIYLCRNFELPEVNGELISPNSDQATSENIDKRHSNNHTQVVT